MTDTVQEIAFRYAVDRVNVRSDILPRSRLTAQIERIPQQDSFYASKQGKYTVKARNFKKKSRPIKKLVKSNKSFQEIFFDQIPFFCNFKNGQKQFLNWEKV